MRTIFTSDCRWSSNQFLVATISREVSSDYRRIQEGTVAGRGGSHTLLYGLLPAWNDTDLCLADWQMLRSISFLPSFADLPPSILAVSQAHCQSVEETRRVVDARRFGAF